MDRQPGALAEVVAAGPGSFASELLEIVGARNAVIGSVRYPKLSREALIKIDPDRVIDASGAAEQSIAAWGDRWNAVAAPTGLATPGPELVDAIAKVERLIFESSGTKADPTP
jgi:iron complex transport system substrate-binding protein